MIYPFSALLDTDIVHQSKYIQLVGSFMCTQHSTKQHNVKVIWIGTSGYELLFSSLKPTPGLDCFSNTYMIYQQRK